MTAASDFLEVELRKHIFRTGSYTKPSTLGVSLTTSAPVDADTTLSGKEVANSNNYARVEKAPLDANWSGGSSTSGLTDNVDDLTFPTASGSWGTVTHFGISDSAAHNGGNMLIYGALAASKAVGASDIVKFLTGALDVTIA